MKLLFVCIENANRSQMAQAFAKIHGGETMQSFSAGSRPSGVVNPDVKGKKSWTFNQEIKFGTYKASSIKRGWIKSSETNFFIRFQKAEQKMCFVQNTPDNVSTTVLIVNNFKNNEIDLLKGFWAFPITFKSSFAGTIIPSLATSLLIRSNLSETFSR